jgi:hypothetical protein
VNVILISAALDRVPGVKEKGRVNLPVYFPFGILIIDKSAFVFHEAFAFREARIVNLEVPLCGA